MDEIEKIKSRYNKRKAMNMDCKNSFLLLYTRYIYYEKINTIIKYLEKYMFAKKGIDEIRLLEIGCGKGNNLVDFIRWGLSPENISGNELIKDDIDIARKRLPEKVQLILGDASKIDSNKKYDIVYQCTVFSSILDENLRQQVADKMWDLVSDDGIILWYDFIYNNPKNKDVRGVPLNEVRKLFPKAKIDYKKVTLAPPIGRIILNKMNSKLLYHILNQCSLLKTHIVCVIKK